MVQAAQLQASRSHTYTCTVHVHVVAMQPRGRMECVSHVVDEGFPVCTLNTVHVQCEYSTHTIRFGWYVFVTCALYPQPSLLTVYIHVCASDSVVWNACILHAGIFSYTYGTILPSQIWLPAFAKFRPINPDTAPEEEVVVKVRRMRVRDIATLHVYCVWKVHCIMMTSIWLLLCSFWHQWVSANCIILRYAVCILFEDIELYVTLTLFKSVSQKVWYVHSL